MTTERDRDDAPASERETRALDDRDETTLAAARAPRIALPGDPTVGVGDDASAPDDPALARLLDDLLARRERGEPIDIEAALEAAPEHEARIRALAATLERLGPPVRADDATRAAPAAPRDAAARDAADELPRVRGYDVLAEIARGGMGIAYRARHRELGREVALKIMRTDRVAAIAAARFRNEARAAARLRHPRIVAIHDVGEDERGRPYYTMDLIDGRSLAADLEESGTLRVAAAVDVVAKVADAVEHAHREGIIHRDLKPANVLIDEAGELYVADFGLAREVSQSGLLTQTGDILGTPAYMSPEQARGEGREVDARTDVWALGVILYELLCGQRPFGGAGGLALLKKIAAEEPVPLREVAPKVPRDLATICHKALQKDRDRRYRTAGALADDLRRFAAGEPILGRLPSPAYRARRWARRHPAVVAAVALAVVVVSMVASTMRGRVAAARRVEATEIAARAERALAAGDARRAADLAREALALSAEVEGGARLLAAALLADGDAAGARAVIDAAARRRALTEEERLVRACALGESGDARSALIELDALAASPRPAVQESLAAAFTRLGATERAARARDRAQTLRREAAGEAVRDAAARLAQGDTDGAAALAGRVLATDPDFGPALEVQAALWRARGDPLRALSFFEAIAERTVEGRRSEARCLVELERFEEAETALRAALGGARDADERDEVALELHALRLRRHAGALLDAVDAMVADPSTDTRGLAAPLGELDAVAADLAALRRRRPDDPRALVLAARIEALFSGLVLGTLEGGLAERALAIAPDDEAARFERAAEHLLAGDRAAARAILEPLARAAGPRAPGVAELLAIAREAGPLPRWDVLGPAPVARRIAGLLLGGPRARRELAAADLSSLAAEAATGRVDARRRRIVVGEIVRRAGAGELDAAIAAVAAAGDVESDGESLAARLAAMAEGRERAAFDATLAALTLDGARPEELARLDVDRLEERAGRVDGADWRGAVTALLAIARPAPSATKDPRDQSLEEARRAAGLLGDGPPPDPGAGGRRERALAALARLASQAPPSVACAIAAGASVVAEPEAVLRVVRARPEPAVRRIAALVGEGEGEGEGGEAGRDAFFARLISPSSGTRSFAFGDLMGLGAFVWRYTAPVEMQLYQPVPTHNVEEEQRKMLDAGRAWVGAHHDALVECLAEVGPEERLAVAFVLANAGEADDVALLFATAARAEPAWMQPSLLAQIAPRVVSEPALVDGLVLDRPGHRGAAARLLLWLGRWDDALGHLSAALAARERPELVLEWIAALSTELSVARRLAKTPALPDATRAAIADLVATQAHDPALADRAFATLAALGVNARPALTLERLRRGSGAAGTDEALVLLAKDPSAHDTASLVAAHDALEAEAAWVTAALLAARLGDATPAPVRRTLGEYQGPVSVSPLLAATLLGLPAPELGKLAPEVTPAPAPSPELVALASSLVLRSPSGDAAGMVIAMLRAIDRDALRDGLAWALASRSVVIRLGGAYTLCALETRMPTDLHALLSGGGLGMELALGFFDVLMQGLVEQGTHPPIPLHDPERTPFATLLDDTYGARASAFGWLEASRCFFLARSGTPDAVPILVRAVERAPVRVVTAEANDHGSGTWSDAQGVRSFAYRLTWRSVLHDTDIAALALARLVGRDDIYVAPLTSMTDAQRDRARAAVVAAARAFASASAGEAPAPSTAEAAEAAAAALPLEAFRVAVQDDWGQPYRDVGLQPGDVIHLVDGRPVSLADVPLSLAPGANVVLLVGRGPQRAEVTVTVEADGRLPFDVVPDLSQLAFLLFPEHRAPYAPSIDDAMRARIIERVAAGALPDAVVERMRPMLGTRWAWSEKGGPFGAVSVRTWLAALERNALLGYDADWLEAAAFTRPGFFALAPPRPNRERFANESWIERAWDGIALYLRDRKSAELVGELLDGFEAASPLSRTARLRALALVDPETVAGWIRGGGDGGGGERAARLRAVVDAALADEAAIVRGAATLLLRSELRSRISAATRARWNERVAQMMESDPSVSVRVAASQAAWRGPRATALAEAALADPAVAPAMRAAFAPHASPGFAARAIAEERDPLVRRQLYARLIGKGEWWDRLAPDELAARIALAAPALLDVLGDPSWRVRAYGIATVGSVLGGSSYYRTAQPERWRSALRAIPRVVALARTGDVGSGERARAYWLLRLLRSDALGEPSLRIPHAGGGGVTYLGGVEDEDFLEAEVAPPTDADVEEVARWAEPWAAAALEKKP